MGDGGLTVETAKRPDCCNNPLVGVGNLPIIITGFITGVDSAAVDAPEILPPRSTG